MRPALPLSVTIAELRIARHVVNISPALLSRPRFERGTIDARGNNTRTTGAAAVSRPLYLPQKNTHPGPELAPGARATRDGDTRGTQEERETACTTVGGHIHGASDDTSPRALLRVGVVARQPEPAREQKRRACSGWLAACAALPSSPPSLGNGDPGNQHGHRVGIRLTTLCAWTPCRRRSC